MADYTRQIALANRLVEAKGAAFTFKGSDGTPADANKPWEAGDAPTTGELHAVAVEPSSANRLGLETLSDDLIQRTTVVLIVAPGDGTVEPKNFTHVEYQGDDHGIVFTRELAPDGAQKILYFVGIGL